MNKREREKMKQIYRLEYRTGWGEHNFVKFEARTLLDAMTIAKNYCTHHFIKIAWLINEKENRYAIL